MFRTDDLGDPCKRGRIDLREDGAGWEHPKATHPPNMEKSTTVVESRLLSTEFVY